MMRHNAASSWIQCAIPRSKAHIRLFCFPYAGGGSLAFYNWPNAFSANIEICSILLPGRECRINEKPIKQIEQLIDHLITAISVRIDLPFAFFGHNLGALVSFELARRLQAMQAPMPNHLFVSACHAPHLPNSQPQIHGLPRNAFIEEVRKYNGTSEAVFENQELLELLIPILRADFAVFETYTHRPGEPLSCPITAFVGKADSKTSVNEIIKWQDMTKKLFRFKIFKGDHFFLHTNKDALTTKIAQSLYQVDTKALVTSS